MRSPLIRFPWGTDCDWSDWTALIDGPEGARPAVIAGVNGRTLTTRFGFAEFFALCRELDAEPMLAANLLDALARRRPLAEAARQAAALVAYANAAPGAAAAGLPDWGARRAAAGVPRPMGVRLVQLGNEWWAPAFRAAVAAGGSFASPAEQGRWYAEVVAGYAAAIHAVDPKIELIVDLDLGLGPDGAAETAFLSDARVRTAVRWVALHAYAPGNMSGTLRRGGADADHAALDADQRWYLWTGMPGRYGADGLARGILPDGHRARLLAIAEPLGYRLACTEWNWNGWKPPPGSPDHSWAAALGAAAFQHGLLRHADRVGIGIQSMLLGVSWNLAAILVAEGGRGSARITPRGRIGAFYAEHRGTRLLALDHPALPTVEQPFTLHWSDPVPRLALLDLVATADGERIRLHAINRHPRTAMALDLDPGALAAPLDAVMTVLTADGAGGVASAESRLALSGGRYRALLPPASVSVLSWTAASAR
jgi:hypothetical protein